MAKQLLNLNLTAAVVLPLAFLVAFFVASFASPGHCYGPDDAAKADSQILKLESLGQWAESRKLMDTSESADIEVRVAAKLMSEGKVERAYEILHDKVVSFYRIPSFCGKVSRRLHMMKETLKNIEKERSKSGVAK